jgi:MFS family permease
MNALQLAWRVLRVDRRTRTSAILTAVGVAVATGLVLLLVSLPFATQNRANRAVWQNTYQATRQEGPQSLLLSDSTDSFKGQKIVRIDVAATGDPAAVKLPNGMPKLPAPGEALVSPALGKLIHSVPGSQLEDRFGTHLAGALTEDALSFPEQLVVVVGHTPAEMSKEAVPVAGFGAGKGDVDGELTMLAGVGVIVLMVPSLVLVASAARLTAARRERRLAAIRLAGATPGQVAGMVAAETSVSAVAGALLGLLLSPALHGLATFVPWAGGTWQASDFTVPVGLTVFLVIALPVLVVLAAALGLRRVLKTPLGAVASHARKPLHWWRLLALPIAGGYFLYAVSSHGNGPGPVFLGLALLVASAALVGPWVTSAVGGTFVRVWRKPAGLLAGRRLRDDPKGAYRASAGVVLAVFAGSMALTLLPSFESLSGGGRSYQDSVIYTSVNGDTAAAVVAKTDAALTQYGVAAHSTAVPTVQLSTADLPGQNGLRSALVLSCPEINQLTRFRLTNPCQPGAGVYSTSEINLADAQVRTLYDQPSVPVAAPVTWRPLVAADSDLNSTLIIDSAAVPPSLLTSPDAFVTIVVPSTPENYETIRTALTNAVGSNASVYSRDSILGNQQTELDDLRRVTVIGLIAAAVLAGCSAAVATAGSVMDRRRTFGALIAAGTPVKLLARALRMEAALPALVATIGAGVVGVFVGIGLFSTANEGSVVLSPWVLAPIVLGIGVALLAASVCTPALNRVRAEPLADE